MHPDGSHLEPPPAPAGQPPPARETLGSRQRLRRAAQFLEAYQQNQSWHGRHMVMFLRTAPDASRRLGVVASRRVGNAVERARAKRRLREVFRRNRAAFTPGNPADVILVARRSLLAAPWPEVVRDLLALARNAGLLPPEAP
ncbi:MAG: ribonuclease P protein component [Lentisphaerae bacterium]|jgi:ribonuclease P protein component|nr:ribonuclease P protein component [Lentisphaerota bacterium]